MGPYFSTREWVLIFHQKWVLIFHQKMGPDFSPEMGLDFSPEMGPGQAGPGRERYGIWSTGVCVTEFGRREFALRNLVDARLVYGRSVCHPKDKVSCDRRSPIRLAGLLLVVKKDHFL